MQNIVRQNEECVKSRVMFWSNFINMYYQGSGSSVNCCQGDDCNRGLGQNFMPWQNKNINEQRLHLRFPGASDSSVLEAAMVETLRTSTALPGAPLTSFFEERVFSRIRTMNASSTHSSTHGHSTNPSTFSLRCYIYLGCSLLTYFAHVFPQGHDQPRAITRTLGKWQN